MTVFEVLQTIFFAWVVMGWLWVAIRWATIGSPFRWTGDTPRAKVIGNLAFSTALLGPTIWIDSPVCGRGRGWKCN